MEAEMRNRVGEGAGVLMGFEVSLKSKGFVHGVKMGMLVGIVVPTIVYSFEVWAVNARQ